MHRSVIEIRGELIQPLLDKVFGEEEPEEDSDQQDSPEEGDPAEPEPWHQQPGEPDNHFRLFQIYLSLMFLQSTAQVAEMAKVNAKSTLDKIARKWSWQARAAAFDAHHDDQPLARAELQNRLLLDKAFTAHLHGLLDTARALQTRRNRPPAPARMPATPSPPSPVSIATSSRPSSVNRILPAGRPSKSAAKSVLPPWSRKKPTGKRSRRNLSLIRS